MLETNWRPRIYGTHVHGGIYAVMEKIVFSIFLRFAFVSFDWRNGSLNGSPFREVFTNFAWSEGRKDQKKKETGIKIKLSGTVA